MIKALGNDIVVDEDVVVFDDDGVVVVDVNVVIVDGVVNID